MRLRMAAQQRRLTAAALKLQSVQQCLEKSAALLRSIENDMASAETLDLDLPDMIRAIETLSDHIRASHQHLTTVIADAAPIASRSETHS